MGKYDFTGLMDGVPKEKSEYKYDFSGLMNEDKPKNKIDDSAYEEAQPAFKSQTLGNIGMTIDAGGAASRAAIRANPALFFAGPYAGLSALSSAEGSKAKLAAQLGMARPSNVMTFQEEMARKASDATSALPRPLVAPAAFVGSSIGQTAGMAADIITNPFDAATIMFGKTPIGGGKTLGTISKKLGGAISKSKVGQALGKFMRKERHLLGAQKRILKKKIGKFEAYRATLPGEKLSTSGRKITSKSKITQEQIKQDTRTALDVINENKKKISLEVRDITQKKIPKIKKSVNEFSEAVGTTYENRLNAISENIGNNIKNTDIASWGDDFIKKVQSESDLADTAAFSKIKSWFNKFKPKKGKLLGPTGKPLTTSEESIAFKRLNGMRKELLKNRKYDGSTSSREHVLYDWLQDDFMKFAGKYTDDFAKLQAESAPMLETKKILNNWIKPNDKVKSNKVEGLLVKYGKGKELTKEEKIVFKMIEDVSKEKGLGLDDIAKAYSGQEKLLSSTRLEKEARLALEKSKFASKKETIAKARTRLKYQKERQKKRIAELAELEKRGKKARELGKYAIRRITDLAIITGLYKGFDYLKKKLN